MRNIWHGNAFHSHSNKTHFHKKGFALGLLIFTENFPCDSWRYSYIQFIGNVTFLCCCFPLIAGQKISSVLTCKRNLQVAHNSCRFHLFCIRLERPCRKPGQWLPKRQQETNKQTKQIKKKKQLSACFLRVSAVILLSWFVGWVNLIWIHFQQTNLYRRFTKLISSYDPFTRYRVVNNDESVHVDRLKN